MLNIDETRSEPRGSSSSERFGCPQKEGRTPFLPFSDLRTTVNIIAADGRCLLTIYLYKDDGTADPTRAGTVPVFHVEVFYYYTIHELLI